MEARRLPHEGPGDPPRGHGDRGRRRGDVRVAVADARGGHRSRVRSSGGERARHGAHRRRARPSPAGRGREEADLQARGVRLPASESYPEDLLYNAEHDWARIEDGEAVLGITWYAADSLGELVHFE